MNKAGYINPYSQMKMVGPASYTYNPMKMEKPKGMLKIFNVEKDAKKFNILYK